MMVEPAIVEPVKVEVTGVEPARVEPARVEPARVEPARLERARIEPAKIELARAERAKGEPALHILWLFDISAPFDSCVVLNISFFAFVNIVGRSVLLDQRLRKGRPAHASQAGLRGLRRQGLSLQGLSL